MADYGKILKKKIENGFIASLYQFNQIGKNSSYTEIMKKNYENGFSQVIINTELMLTITESMLRDEWTLISIHIDDPSVDEETKQEINSFVEMIKSNPLNFNKLSNYLDWALDEGSIFIDKIKMSKKVDDEYPFCELYSNGLLFGNAKDVVFANYLQKIIEGYLNE